MRLFGKFTFLPPSIGSYYTTFAYKALPVHLEIITEDNTLVLGGREGRSRVRLAPSLLDHFSWR